MAFSDTGILSFIPAASSDRELVWVNDRGVVESVSVFLRAYEKVSLAPNGDQIAVSIESQTRGHPEANADVWLYDMSLGTLTQLTFNGMSTMPQWFPDSKRLAYLKYDPGERMNDLRCLYIDGSCTSDSARVKFSFQ